MKTFITLLLIAASAGGISARAENHLKIPEKHWFLADGIASDLFIL